MTRVPGTAEGLPHEVRSPRQQGNQDLIAPRKDLAGCIKAPESAGNAGDPGSMPGSGRSPGETNGTPLQYSWPENPTDRGARRTTVYRVAKSHP